MTSRRALAVVIREAASSQARNLWKIFGDRSVMRLIPTIPRLTGR
ncbi:hypothetical protein MMSP_3622 [Mycobacterium sp. 012931]|nr:hypothetical protein MMSP_3622 [Mycobacterium sp. 012931]